MSSCDGSSRNAHTREEPTVCCTYMQASFLLQSTGLCHSHSGQVSPLHVLTHTAIISGKTLPDAPKCGLYQFSRHLSIQAKVDNQLTTTPAVVYLLFFSFFSFWPHKQTCQLRTGNTYLLLCHLGPLRILDLVMGP